MIEGNVIVTTKKLKRNRDLIPYLFGDEINRMPTTILYVSEGYDMYDVLVEFGLFASRSDARKNWTRTGQEIPNGFSDFEGIGKRNNRLTIWKPI